MILRTYWKGLGKHQQYLARLDALILTDGSVFEPSKNPALVHFRKAWIIYYELHAENMVEQYSEFAATFDIGAAEYKIDNGFDDVLYSRVEEVMDTIVVNAAKEQKLIRRFLGMLR